MWSTILKAIFLVSPLDFKDCGQQFFHALLSYRISYVFKTEPDECFSLFSLHPYGMNKKYLHLLPENNNENSENPRKSRQKPPKNCSCLTGTVLECFCIHKICTFVQKHPSLSSDAVFCLLPLQDSQGPSFVSITPHIIEYQTVKVLQKCWMINVCPVLRAHGVTFEFDALLMHCYFSDLSTRPRHPASAKGSKSQLCKGWFVAKGRLETSKIGVTKCDKFKSEPVCQGLITRWWGDKVLWSWGRRVISILFTLHHLSKSVVIVLP